VKVEIDLP